MEKYDYQVQLTVTEHPQKKNNNSWGHITRQIPCFILPSLLGLTSWNSAKKTCLDMFPKYEVHGSIMDSEYKTFEF